MKQIAVKLPPDVKTPEDALGFVTEDLGWSVVRGMGADVIACPACAKELNPDERVMFGPGGWNDRSL